MLIAIVLISIVVIIASVRIIQQYETGVVFSTR